MDSETLPKPSLSRLSEADQAIVYGMCCRNSSAYRTGKAIVKFLQAEFDIEITEQYLSKWKQKYEEQQQLREEYQVAEERRQVAVQERRKTHPEETEGQLFEFGQQIFADAALTNKDPETWVKIQRLRLDEKKMGLESRRIHSLEDRVKQLGEALALAKQKFLEARRDTIAKMLKILESQQAKAIEAAPTSNSDKIEKLGQLMFGEDWK